MSKDFALSDDYTLRYDFDALEFLEEPEMLGEPLPAVMADPLKAQSLKVQKRLLYVGLRFHHPDLKLSEVGAIFDDVGLEQTGTAVRAAMARAFPDVFPADDADPDGGEGNA